MFVVVVLLLVVRAHARRSLHFQQSTLSSIQHNDDDEPFEKTEKIAEAVEVAHVGTEVAESVTEAVMKSFELGHVVAPELANLAVGAGFGAVKTLIKKSVERMVYEQSHAGFLDKVGGGVRR